MRVNRLFHPLRNRYHVIFFEPTSRYGWCAKSYAAWTKWRQWIIGNCILVESQTDFIERLFGNATIIQKKLEAYNSVIGAYPVAATATTTLNGQIESNLGSSVAIGTPTAANGKGTFQVKFCTAPAGATGYQLTYWDYTTTTLPGTPQVTGGTSTIACTTWSANAV